MEYRVEHDSMGEICVPADKYWGAQTERSHNNFPIGVGIETMPAEIIHAFGILKKAAARANRALRPEKMTGEKLSAIEQAADRAGYTLVLHQIRSGEDELQAAASLARSRRLRGLVLLGGCFDYTPEQTAALDIPFVCCSFTNSFGSLKKDAYSSVSVDDQAEACRAVRYLIAKGHRKIAIVLDSTCDHSVSELRYRGYCQALEEAGIPLDSQLVEESRDFGMAAAYAGTCRLLRRRQDFTALFVIADSMAVAAMKALHDCGRRVPEDCSVIAIDGIEMSDYTVPTLTTLIQPKEAMGAEAVGILVDMIERRSGNRHVRAETTLRPGGSVRAIP